MTDWKWLYDWINSYLFDWLPDCLTKMHVALLCQRATQPVSEPATRSPANCALHSTFIEEIFGRDCTITAPSIISLPSLSLSLHISPSLSHWLAKSAELSIYPNVVRFIRLTVAFYGADQIFSLPCLSKRNGKHTVLKWNFAWTEILEYRIEIWDMWKQRCKKRTLEGL